MKLKFLLSLSVVCLSSLMVNASTEKIKCVTLPIECEGGGGTNYSACGTYDSLTTEYAEVKSIVCN